MFVAKLNNEIATAARTGERARCFLCDEEVIAKVGTMVAAHWAHHSRADCDDWYEMSDWHRDWQAKVPPERREVVIGNHRADAVTPRGAVVEFQHSAIPPDQVEVREKHYGTGVWVVDMFGRDFAPAWTGRARWRVLLDPGPESDVLIRGGRTITKASFIAWLNEEGEPAGPVLLDWGRAKINNPPRPCALCNYPATMIDPEGREPKHKVCAEELKSTGL